MHSQLADPVIGVDIGGTKIAAAPVDTDGSLGDIVRVESPAADRQALLDSIVEATTLVQAAMSAKPRAVGLAAAGYLNRDRSEIMFSPNINWRNEPLPALVSQRIGLPVTLENDANAAAWGEAQCGAGAGHRDVLMVTLGTGVGGGVISDGVLLTGGRGVGAELGHTNYERGGRLCGCGLRGCVEMYLSGRALDRAAAEAAESHGLADSWRGTCGDQKPIGAKHAEDAARAGDPVALRVLADHGRILGEVLADWVAIFDPTIIVVGGGVSAAGDLILAPARQELANNLTGIDVRPAPEVVVAGLGWQAGIVGAGLVAASRIAA